MNDGQSSFYSLIFRQKYIKRWGLMNSTMPENLTEHSAETAVLAHALAVIGNKYFGKSYDPAKAAELALFHDVPEVYTGDLPTPIKYFSPQMRESYSELEETAVRALTDKLPEEMREIYGDILREGSDPEMKKLVKAADKLSAYIKALTEETAGNREFSKARKTLSEALDRMECPELEYFRAHFLDSFTLTIDEIQD